MEFPSTSRRFSIQINMAISSFLGGIEIGDALAVHYAEDVTDLGLVVVDTD